jgi:hypothetical protein
MKKLFSVCAVFLLGTTMALAQSDQPATSTDNNRTTATDVSRNPDVAPRRAENRDWGWIGLLGLLGLAGLKRRRSYDSSRIDSDRNRDYKSGDLRKTG